MSSYTTFNANTGNTNTTANFTGLDNGKYYQFRVSAINSEGSGVVALSDKALVSGPPNAVTSLTPTIGANSVSLSWTKPSSSGGKLITGYKIESKLYAETVSDALASLSATAGNGECAVSWVAPTNFGYSDITGYKVEYAASPYNTWSVATASVNSLTYTVTGLTNGTSYKFRVSVINGIGTSSPTESSIATPQALPPDPPTSLTVLGGEQQFTGSWTAPTNDGGAAITGYDLLYAPGPSYNSFTTVPLGNTTSYTVLSLTNGTSYKFKVSAKNSGGTGTASALSSAVTPNPFSISNTGATNIHVYTYNSIHYMVHEFHYTSGTQTTYTFTVTGSKSAEVFIVGGGGSGGSAGGGGGGGGGVVYDPNITLGSGTYTVKVGNGGDVNTNRDFFGEKGSDSEITTVPTNAITTSLSSLKGKGGGAGYPKDKNSATESGADGGSGGGADHSGWTPRPAGDSNQGNTYWNGSSWVAGGHSGGVSYKGGAGGGGAGGAAPNQTSSSSNSGSRGGHGVDNNWLGDDNGNNKGSGWRNYAGGGGGGHWNGHGGHGGQSASNDSINTKGSGGGGFGINAVLQTSGHSHDSADGKDHRGGGGGGSSSNAAANEGRGGSGIVLIRYQISSSSPPYPPVTVNFTPGNTEATVNWTAPAWNGGSVITGYKVEYAADPYSSWTVAVASTSSSPYTVTGLTNGTSYKARVSAINILGTSTTTLSSAVTPAIFSATGGTITTYTVSNVNYKVHTFLTSATFTVAGDSKVMDFLIVAGGGGGASRHGGGGGAGGLVVGTSQTITPGTHNVVIGGGGNKLGGVPSGTATSGSDSSFNNITASGGGGGSSSGQGLGGGSAGGTRGNRNNPGGVSNQNDYNNVTNVTGYGNDGGRGKYAGNGGGGGGGGAGAQGQNAPNNNGGVGGDGIQNSFRTGSNEYYAGGGAGGGPDNLSHAGGQGGGGTGGATSESERHATINTGGGGGAGGHYNNNQPGGDGGSGIVVIRYVV